MLAIGDEARFPLSDSLKIKFTVSSDLQNLSEVLDQSQALYHETIPRKDWLQFQLALAEGFTNAVRHAHRHLPKTTPVDIALVRTPQTLSLEVFDRGEPFDLAAMLHQIAQRGENTTGSGRGLEILLKIADQLSYQRQPDQRNCLQLIKSFGPD